MLRVSVILVIVVGSCFRVEETINMFLCLLSRCKTELCKKERKYKRNIYTTYAKQQYIYGAQFIGNSLIYNWRAEIH